MIYVLGFGDRGLESRVYTLESKVWGLGLGFVVRDLRFRVWG
jgi:hypothetical protein